MKANAEDIKSSARSFIAYEYESQAFEHPYHFHQETEIVFVRKGAGKVLIGNTYTEFEDNDIFIIGANMPHRFCSYQPLPYLRSDILQFNNNCFGEDFFSSVELYSISQFISYSRNGMVIRQGSSHLFELMSQLIRASGVQSLLCFIRLLDELSHYPDSSVVLKKYESADEIKMETKISDVSDWIDRNFQMDINLEDIATRTRMNKHAFCRAFKQQTGKSPMQYLTERRIDAATTLLLSSGKTITEVGFSVGFSSASSFNRNFKKLRHCSPKTYREMTKFFNY